MLPPRLWLLVLSLVPSIESHSFPELRAVRFSNATSTERSLSASPTSIQSSSLSSVLRSTATSEAFSNTEQTTTRPPRKSSTSASSSDSEAPSRTLRNGTQSVTNAASCCFVIQDTVSEEWWQRTSYGSTTSLVNLTSYTTYVSEFPNVTTTRVETNVYTTNAAFTFTYLMGKNPITNLVNDAPTATEVTQELTGKEVVTAGVTMYSPSAFYVYSTVKIITVEPVTDRKGNVYCATESVGLHNDVFPRMNGNAQAYFGGPDIAGQSTFVVATTSTEVSTATVFASADSSRTYSETETFTVYDEEWSTVWTNKDGDIVTQTSTPTGVTISLVTPFLYAPERGTSRYPPDCSQGDDTEAYGYIPNTLIDFLVSDPYYSSQYPGLESCYGGGPSIIQYHGCGIGLESPTYQSVGGDLTSSTTIYVHTPEIHQDSTITTTPSQTMSVASVPTSDGQPLTAPPKESKKTGSLYTVPPPVSTLSPSPKDNGLGSLINSLAGNPPVSTPPDGPITIQQVTTVPISQAPAGAVGVSTDINGTPVIIISPTTIPPQSPNVVITAATIIPVSLAPQGAVGTLSTIDGTPVLILGPTTIQASAQTPQPITIAAVTTVPLSKAPPGAVGSTTTINGTPFLVIQPTTITQAPTATFTAELAEAGFQTITISGTAYMVIPRQTSIPLSLAPYGLQGSTTTINGTPYLVINAATTIPVINGGITVVGGTTELIITAPTTMPLNPLFPVSGQTTVIGGTTMVVVSSAVTVVEVSSTSSDTSSSASRTLSIGGSQAVKSPSTSSSKGGAAPTGTPGSLLQAIGIAAGGAMIAMF